MVMSQNPNKKHHNNFTSHTLIHTFAILSYPLHFVPDSLGGKCELRDVIYSFAVAEMTLTAKFFQLKSTFVNRVDTKPAT